MTTTVRAIPRSILYTPALSLDRVAKAWSYDADVHLIDLEDAVPPEEKPAARLVCQAALEKAPAPANVAVRVNVLGTIDAVHDLMMLADSPVKPGFIVMTMVKSAVEVALMRDTLASAGARPEIFVTVETVEAITNIDAIAAAADGLVLGSADLAATLGIEITWAGLLAARQAMALACARHGTACIDTANFQISRPEVLAEEINRVRELGFHGKATVHPKELGTINRALRPNPDGLRLARRVTEAVRAADGGIAVLDGNMIGPPFAGWPTPRSPSATPGPSGSAPTAATTRRPAMTAVEETDAGAWPVTISAKEMVGADRLRRVIDALADAFGDLSAGRTRSPSRTVVEHGPDRQLLAGTAVWERRGVGSVKITTLTPDNQGRGLPLIHGVVVLTDLETGRITALLDGGELTAVRTGAVAALATRLCAPADAGELALIGAGVQARALVRAVSAVRPIRSVRIFSRTPARTEKFAEWIRGTAEHPMKVTVCNTAKTAVTDAAIICTATSTSDRRPLVAADWVAPGAHVNVIGGTHEEAIEVDPALLGDAFVIVEERAAALADAVEVRAALADGLIAVAGLHELGALVNGEITADGRTSVFRSVGMAIEDTAAAAALYAAATATGDVSPPRGTGP